MPYDDVTFTREKLYGEVWTRPVTQLAEEIGVSDVALAKICRKLNVPVPARGYWAQVAAGQSPRKPALPPPTATTPQTHVSRVWRAPEGAIGPFAVVENTAVEFGLEEGYETIEVPPPPPSGVRETRSWDLPRPVKERIPNGRLVLTIRNAPRSERLTCGDTKRQAIEARLGSFILMLEATSSAIKVAKVEAARQAEENRRWQEERQKDEDRRRLEEALVGDLAKRLELWLAAARYRQLADAVEALAVGDSDLERRAVARVGAVLRHARRAGGRSGIAGSRAGPGAPLAVLILDGSHECLGRPTCREASERASATLGGGGSWHVLGSASKHALGAS